ncbi:MAG: hypothetical protein JXB25_01000 [Deltaproteobacteria bacterium]|nr:hypothetical protein [Deltaproteobacteria bacterium]
MMAVPVVGLVLVLGFFPDLCRGADPQPVKPLLKAPPASAQPSPPARKKPKAEDALPVRPGPEVAPAIAPDLVVSIVSIGVPCAENRDPVSGRVESGGSPEATPIQVTIPLTVQVRNLGRSGARPIRVAMEAQGGMPPGYLAYGFHVAGSRLPSMLYLDETLPPGGERTFRGTLYSPQFTLALYRSDAEGVTMRYRAVVDPPFSGHPAVREANEANNLSAWSRPMNLPRATLVVPGSPVPRPDLSVSIGEIALQPDSAWRHGAMVYDRYDVQFTLFNRGTANYRGQGGDEPGWQLFYHAESAGGWVAAARGGCLEISAGGLREMVVRDLDIPRNGTRVKVVADPENREIELNEANNSAEKSIFRMLPAPGAPGGGAVPR